MYVCACVLGRGGAVVAFILGREVNMICLSGTLSHGAVGDWAAHAQFWGRAGLSCPVC
jgi:hypothetical protein